LIEQNEQIYTFNYLEIDREYRMTESIEYSRIIKLKTQYLKVR